MDFTYLEREAPAEASYLTQAQSFVCSQSVRRTYLCCLLPAGERHRL